MAWRDNLREASFRGVPFHVDEHELGGGRRGTLHEYPERDVPFFEDLGRKAREYRIEAYLVGPEYMTARDRLLDALEAAGTGTLVHPYYGAVQVAVSSDGFRARETRDQGGYARISVTFVQAGENRYPSASADTRLRTSLAADTALDTIAGSFADNFQVDARPQFVADAAEILGGGFADSIDRLLGGLPTVGDLPALPDVNRLLGGYRDALPSLVQDGPSYISSVLGLVGSIAGLIDDPLARVRALLNLADWGQVLAAVSATTVSRQRQASNQTAFVAATRRISVTEAARASATATFDSFDQAQATRTQLADALDAELDVAGAGFEDGVYTDLAELRAAAVSDITARSVGLGRLVDLTPAATQPDVVLAYRFYGDATRAADISTRNAVRHPGFVPGGRTLKVLADG